MYFYCTLWFAMKKKLEKSVFAACPQPKSQFFKFFGYSPILKKAVFQ